MDEQLKKVCQAFRLPGTYLGYEAIQVGIVNQTYKVNVRLEDGKEKSFLVQNVNTYAFRNPIGLMNNIDLVTEHIRQKCPEKRSLHFHHTEDRKTYLLDGKDVGKMSRRELASIRNEKLGFIFQQYNLLPKLTLLENVEVPLIYAGVGGSERRSRAIAALEQVGLGSKLRNKPNQLSGGQQQRVSIARALVRNPPIILADEPTGALDSHTGREVLGMLQELHKQGHTVVLITHDNSIAVQAQRIIRLEDGHVIYDGDAGAPEAVVTPNLAGRGMAG